MKHSELVSLVKEELAHIIREKKAAKVEEEPVDTSIEDIDISTEEAPEEEAPMIDPIAKKVNDSLNNALAAAREMGDDKLSTLIENTKIYLARVLAKQDKTA